jgi:hypothetical protein
MADAQASHSARIGVDHTVLRGCDIILLTRMEGSPKRRPSSECVYQRDSYSWALEQARVLRERRAAELDWDNLAEEVEDLAHRDAQALQSNCEVLIAHLLKLTYANESLRRRNLRLWQLHVRNAQRRISDLLAENPGLKSRAGELFAKAWPYGRDEALATLGFDDNAIPDACPWTFEQAGDTHFWPAGKTSDPK